jgi:hypothetical protein
LEVAKAWLGADAVRSTGSAATYERLPLPVISSTCAWHDRAVLHFLTDANDRVAYVRQVAHAVKPGGHVIVATFGPEGPTKCSRLDVVRYDPEALHNEFGTAFRLIEHRTELHRTPMGSTQQFTYCYCKVSEIAGPLRTARPLNLRVRTAVPVVPVAAI